MWNLFFLNLRNWLPQLKDIQLTDQDSVMIQYKAENSWKPLAGDEQLNDLLNEFNNSGCELRVRCAPESEFESGSDESGCEDDTVAIRNNYGQGRGGSSGAYKEDNKIVGRLTQPIPYRLEVLIADGAFQEAWRVSS